MGNIRGKSFKKIKRQHNEENNANLLNKNAHFRHSPPIPGNTCIVCGYNNVWRAGIMLATCREEARDEQQQQQQQHFWPQVCETTNGDHFNSTQMKIASVSVLREKWREDANADADLDSDFGFAIAADCAVNNIYIELLLSTRKSSLAALPVNCFGKYALTRQVNFNNKCSLERTRWRKNADHLFWPAMNLIDNFCTGPVTQPFQPILHLSGWENIWIYACA